MKKAIKVTLFIGVLAAVSWSPVKSYLFREFGESTFTIGYSLMLQRLGLREEPGPDSMKVQVDNEDIPTPESVKLDSPYVPFREIGASLGDSGRFNSIIIYHGAAIFDANSDGLLDIYMPHSGRPVEKRVDDRHVLLDEYVPAKPSTLFLNQGNDSNGQPVFKSVQELLTTGNKQNTRQELMVENKYRPRNDISEDPFTPGRIAQGAVAADFNGDGRLDLYVTNTHQGMLSQTEQFGMPVYPAKTNLGRAAKASRERVLVRAGSFLWGEMSDGKDVTLSLGDQPEAEGRNSLFINLGDQDGDGIPEWKDVTDEAGVGGRWASAGAAVSDFDRDGDLDLYVSNFGDPDFWGFGAKSFAGQRNQLYVNQLSETGELKFVNRAEDMKVSGLHDQEGLASGVWNPITGQLMKTSLTMVDGRQVGEKADHSWSSLFTDFNHDGWPDLIVANDMTNRLRVYENQEGKGFKYIEKFNDSSWDGCWMGLSAADFDGDMKEEVLAANCGTQGVTARNTAIFIEDGNEVNNWALFTRDYLVGKSTLQHAMLRYNGDNELEDIAPDVKINHSPYIAPDITDINNFTHGQEEFYRKHNIDSSLTGIEFAWNTSVFDVDNDGDLDIYMAGALRRGNDNFVGDWSGSPGRMLVNESSPDNFEFTDRTLEYRLLDITNIDYDHSPPRRPSPGTGWHKRDYIYLSDKDSYSGSGLDASKSSIRDIFRMHECASNVYDTDLNGDGYMDLVVLHTGGYNSLSPKARNLKVAFAGRLLAVPAPNKIINPPTNFEDGHTSIYINGGAPNGETLHWIKIRLLDDTNANRFAIGSEVVVNGHMLRSVSIGGSFGSVTGDLHVGLGDEKLSSLEIHWASGDMAVQKVSFGEPVADQVICIGRNKGVIPCAGAEAGILSGAGAVTDQLEPGNR